MSKKPAHLDTCQGEASRAYLGAAGGAPGHDASPSPAIMPRRGLHKVVGNLGPPSGLQRLPHVPHILILWPSA